MLTNTVKRVNAEVVPFFARFLKEQANQGSIPSSFPLSLTFKFPSDEEDT